MKLFRKLLFPFSLLYAAITSLRNKLYNHHILSSEKYARPVICVGNLNTGGTGKSPMIAYLLELLLTHYKVASLSRGYKREKKGFILLTGKESAREVGDEPLQFKTNLSNALVAVDANRKHGISALWKAGANIVLLDDAFQHRKVQAGLTILLSAYKDLYVHDWVLPAGNLRETRGGAKRAEVVVVTKCPENLSRQEQDEIRKELKLAPFQKLFFSYIAYAEKVSNGKTSIALQALKDRKIAVVTGIAKPQPFLFKLREEGLTFTHFKFADHHQFTDEEIKKFSRENFILTTEKDFMRLQHRLPEEALFYLSIKTAFLNGTGAGFKTIIRNFVEQRIEDGS